jgi:lipopolysaccharide transport system permease protein
VFPRWILVATSLAHASIPFAVFSLGLLVALAAQHRLPGPLGLLAYLACALQLAGIVLGLSLASSVLLLRYRDLNQVWDVLLQAGFFAAPVVYPLELVPAAVRPFLRLWPPTAAIEYARTVMVHRELPGLDVQAVLAALTILSLGLGLAVYRRYEPAIAELV